ncbi:MAG TPA: TonB-dependent receptor [Amaricoccus sp.]|uniref:TonB-dependent receptor n=1 Tax=Amaricoccus sp. TaxID=1872485 RepID=UPI002B8F75AA|nr:TonB-dependent receptor [Amaricoccus sp.]HMQ93902.1 TonB-dependent receptor [Amaricoccus sp.]HMR51054.1 TonB-dependent receptor [Amaricoccus sp.]HMR62146.1 TonB-dependent receptor [Amaricoccus sp.]HMU00331.1 TonB-dependent receptor [Amaricoccus sp.]
MAILRSRPSGASLLALGLALALPAGVRAQGAAGAAVAFDIPAQPMMAALADFTAATGVQVIAPGGGIGGTSAPVSGPLRPEAALGQLLAGSGYSFSFTGPQTVVLSATATAAETAGDGGLLLGPILVTGATGVDVPGASQVVIGPQDIERLAPRDLADLFRITPSVSVGSSIPMSQKLYVNGVEETNLAVSIDGARQNNRIFHHNSTNVIDPALLAQARVEAGVAPADAGPGALGGAVTYETIDARDLLGFEAGIGARSYNTFDFNGNVATSAFTAYGMRDGFELLASVNVGKGNDFEDGDGNIVDGSETDFISSLVKGAWESEEGHRFELGYERVADDADRPFRANITSVGFNDGLRQYDITRQNLVFTYTDESPEGWRDPRVVIGYAQTELSVPDPWGSEGETGSLSGRIENEFALGLGTVVAGVDAYRDEATYSDPDYSATETGRNFGLYAQARLEPFERTRIGIGGRYDFHRLEGVNGATWDDSGFSGNIGGEYDLTDGLTVRAAYSHVWAGPSLAENFLMNPDWDYADDPQPMTANNVTAGFAYSRDAFLFEANWFRTDLDDVRTATWTNGAESRDLTSEGFELAAGYAWADGQVRVGYTDTDVEIDGLVADSYLGNYLGVPAGQAFVVDATHSFPAHGLTLGGDAEFGLENDDTEATEGGRALPSYQVVNVFAEYEPAALPTVTLRAEVRNLFDRQYSARSTYGQDFVDVTPLAEPGRSFVLAAVARF